MKFKQSLKMDNKKVLANFRRFTANFRRIDYNVCSYKLHLNQKNKMYSA